jgi:hypothetical protein
MLESKLPRMGITIVQGTKNRKLFSSLILTQHTAGFEPANFDPHPIFRGPKHRWLQHIGRNEKRNLVRHLTQKYRIMDIKKKIKKKGRAPLS